MYLSILFFLISNRKEPTYRLNVPILTHTTFLACLLFEVIPLCSMFCTWLPRCVQGNDNHMKIQNICKAGNQICCHYM